MRSLRENLYEFIEGFLSLVYPHTCVVCDRDLSDLNEFLCFSCKGDLFYTSFEKYQEPTMVDQLFWGRLKIENVFSLLFFEKGNSTQKILHTIKYKDGKDLGVYMGKMIGKKLKEAKHFDTIDAIVPVPLHSKKEFSRGYNQSLLISKGVAEELDTPIVEALYRTRHDASQTKKSKEERYQNVKGKFALKKEALDGYEHVLIVDDVLTTGATLEFAARAVMSGENPIKTSLATIAVAR